MKIERIEMVEACRNIVSIYYLNMDAMDVLFDTARKTDAQNEVYFFYKHLLTLAIDNPTFL